MKTLIITDSLVVMRILNNILKQNGVEDIECAEDARYSMYLCDRESFNLVILDWDLKSNNVENVIKKIRNKNKDICIMALSKSARKESVLSAYNCGVTVFLRKKAQLLNVYPLGLG